MFCCMVFVVCHPLAMCFDSMSFSMSSRLAGRGILKGDFDCLSSIFLGF